MMRMKAREGRREKEAKDEKGTNTFGSLVHSVGEKKKKKKKSGVFITLIIPPRLFSSSIIVDTDQQNQRDRFRG